MKPWKPVLNTPGKIVNGKILNLLEFVHSWQNHPPITTHSVPVALHLSVASFHYFLVELFLEYYS